MPDIHSVPSSSMYFIDDAIEKFYNIGEELGSGQFAVVRRVTKRESGHEFAAKFIKKRRYVASRRGVPKMAIDREVDVLREVGGHENVIRLYQVFETSHEVILILELVSGGELFDHVCSKEYLMEAEAAAFVKQILNGIKHLHEKYICHLDLKPENVMLKKRGETLVKLIDFGLSRRVLPGAVIKEMIGTPEFVAPEIVSYEPLSTATDMWALGVITYILLSGGSPFLGDTRRETFENITGCCYQFDDLYFKSTSAFAKDFIARLFVRDPRKRATVDECFRHPWIAGPDHNQADLRKSTEISIAQIHRYKMRRRWKDAYQAVVLCNRLIRQAKTGYLRLNAHQRTVCALFDPDDFMRSAILIACEEGNLEGLNELFENHKIHLNGANKAGETAVHISSGAGHQDLINFLDMKGALLDVADCRGDTPLFWAARRGHSQVVIYLCDSGANVNASNYQKETALHVASRFAQTDCVLALLENNIDIDALNEDEDTAVHIASLHGYALTLSVLCRFGPQLMCQNKEEDTALHCAAARGHLECVQTLLDSGAPVDAQNRSGQTALHLALGCGHMNVALLLMTKAGRLDLRDVNGDTVLHVACKENLLTAVQTLCHLGSPLDFLNASNLAPVHIAAKEGCIEIVRCLCLAGCNIGIKNKDGLTAEIMALAQENCQIGSLLGKLKLEQTKDLYVEQLCRSEGAVKRIKLKLFGHSLSGKTRLVQTLQTGVIGSLMSAVSRRFSESSTSSSKEDGSSDRHEANNVNECNARRHGVEHNPLHTNYTRGIDVQSVNIPGAGEFSVWEFGGYEPYHMAYDHFVGNSDCIHMVMFRASDPTEIQYKHVLYWMNFLKGRVTPTEPIGHCGIISRRSKVVIVGSHASSSVLRRTEEGEYVSEDGEALLSTVTLRFQSHFDIHQTLILLDATQPNCPGIRSLKVYLHAAREAIISRLQKPLNLLDATVVYLTNLRKQSVHFPVVTWPHFTSLIRNHVNVLAGDGHCRQLIQQLQLIGEVVYLRDETCELDYVVISPEWVGLEVIGALLSADTLARCPVNGCYSLDDFSRLFPEMTQPDDMLQILDTLQLCCPLEGNDDTEYEFPPYIVIEAPQDVWQKEDKRQLIYGGLRVLPMRGMERSLISTFLRVQTALRRSMQDFQDPMDAELVQWSKCSKMSSGQMEAVVRLAGDAVEVRVRGPPALALSCFYFMEDVTSLVEQTILQVAPGVSLERHFLSPRDLTDHKLYPSVYPPESIMAMQQRQCLSVSNSRDEQELFVDIVCFGCSRVASVLSLGIDLSVAQLQLTARCELAALLDPSDSMGRDWSILAVKLNLTEQLPELDSTGQSLSRTDQLLAEWALQSPQEATVGKLCQVLTELGRFDCVSALYRTVPLYLLMTSDEAPSQAIVSTTDCNISTLNDSGLASCNQSGTSAASH